MLAALFLRLRREKTPVQGHGIKVALVDHEAVQA
jgi:hypothetical protein